MQTKEERKNINGKDSHQRQRNNGKMSEFRLVYIHVERTVGLALGREFKDVLTMSLALL
jgi:hypothetical protein